MKITTLIPNRNNAQSLPRLLDSTLRQSYPPAEVVVLDDCSTDNSLEVIQTYQAKYPTLKVVRYPSKADNWLHSLYLNLPSLIGDFIHNISSDDFAVPGFYKAAKAMHDKYPEAPCIFADSYVVNPVGIILGQSRSLMKNEFLIGESLNVFIAKQGLYGGGAACLVTTSGYRFLMEREAWKMGPYNDSIGYAVLAAQKGAIFLDKPYGAVTRVTDDAGHGGRVRSDPVQVKQVTEGVEAFLNDATVVSTVSPVILNYLRRAFYQSLDSY